MRDSDGTGGAEEDETNAGAIGAGVAPPPGVSCVDEKREECETWACAGECVANPGFMRQSCPCACAAVAARENGGVTAITGGAADASRGIALGLTWTSPGGQRRKARVRIKLNAADSRLDRGDSCRILLYVAEPSFEHFFFPGTKRG